jgi:hypothetical protein
VLKEAAEAVETAEEDAIRINTRRVESKPLSQAALSYPDE